MSTATAERPATRNAGSRQPITMNGHTYAKYYKPTPIRRRERLVEVVNDVAFFDCYSMTREGRETKHHQQIALTGACECRCDCENFTYKLAKGSPTMFSKPWALCKHLHRSIGILERRGELPQQNGQFAPICVRCGAVGAEVLAYDETGNVPQGRICPDCIEADLSIDYDDSPGYTSDECAAIREADEEDMYAASTVALREEKNYDPNRVSPRAVSSWSKADSLSVIDD